MWLLVTSATYNENITQLFAVRTVNGLVVLTVIRSWYQYYTLTSSFSQHKPVSVILPGKGAGAASQEVYLCLYIVKCLHLTRIPCGRAGLTVLLDGTRVRGLADEITVAFQSPGAPPGPRDMSDRGAVCNKLNTANYLSP